MDKVTFERVRAFHKGEGELNAMLDAFGEDLAKKMGYQHLNGIEAIHLYLVHKHHWLPSVVRSLSYEDLQLERLNRPSPVDRFLVSGCHGRETYVPQYLLFMGIS